MAQYYKHRCFYQEYLSYFLTLLELDLQIENIFLMEKTSKKEKNNYVWNGSAMSNNKIHLIQDYIANSETKFTAEIFQNLLPIYPRMYRYTFSWKNVKIPGRCCWSLFILRSSTCTEIKSKNRRHFSYTGIFFPLPEFWNTISTHLFQIRINSTAMQNTS